MSELPMTQQATNAPLSPEAKGSAEAGHATWRAMIVLPAAALAIAGCSARGAQQIISPDKTSASTTPSSTTAENSQSVPATSVGPTPSTLTPTTTMPRSSESHIVIAGCEQPGVPVKPGLWFNEGNNDDIQKSLDTLHNVVQGDQKAMFTDVVHAAASFNDSLEDPSYAWALQTAVTDTEKANAADLLAMSAKFSAVPNCLTKLQISRAYAVGKTYVVGLAPKIADQTSIRAKYLFNHLVADFNAFAEEHGLQQIHPN